MLVSMEPTRATLFIRLNADGAEREIAWAEFCRRYEPIIAAFARGRGARPHEVAELVQKVVTDFFGAQPRFVYDAAKGSFRAYLKTCVCNELHRIRRVASRPGTVEPAEHQFQSKEDEDVWEATWRRQCLQLALDQLRSSCGETNVFQAFEATVIHERDPAEVGRSLGMSRDSVYQAKSRLLARLHVILLKIDAELGTHSMATGPSTSPPNSTRGAPDGPVRG
jgi:RNA polymerase sigma-70 factor (ECF subfamily)